VHRILAEKASANARLEALSNIYPEVEDDPEYEGEVTIVRLSNFNPEFLP